MAFSWRGLNNAYQRKRLEDREDRKREEEIALSRENALLQLGLTKRKDRAKFRSSEPYREAAEAVMKLEKRLEDLELGDEEKGYFEKLKTDPLAVKEAFDFIDEQETKYGNVITLPDLPLLFEITSSNASVQEQMNLVEIITGKSYVGEEGKKNFIEMASRLNDIATTPGRTVFTDITPGSRVDQTAVLTREEKQKEALESLVVVKANNYLNKLGTDPLAQQTKDTKRFIEMLKDTTQRSIGLQGLLNIYATPFEIYNLETLAPGFRGITNTVFFNDMITTFTDYATLDLSNPNHSKAVEDLKRDPSREVKRRFDFQFGPGAASRVLGQS
jgi:hypothetical protein